MSVSTLITYNLAIYVNVLPRLIAICQHKEKLYEQSPEDKLIEMMEEQFQQYGLRNNKNKIFTPLSKSKNISIVHNDPNDPESSSKSSK